MKINRLKKILRASLLMTCIVLLVGCSGQVIQTVKEESEANKIIDILREQGIIARKFASGQGEKAVYDIYISGGEEEYGAAIQLMEDHCLPQPIPPEVETSGLVSSIEVEKAQELRRTKINLESLLRNLHGTTCVTVKIVPPEKSSLSLNPHKASATVLVKYKTEKYGLSVDEIASTVAKGVQGLTSDNVHVTLARQPLRPLPDLDRGRNIRRIIYVSLIGLITILLFLGVVIFLRKRKNDDPADEFDELENDDDTNQIENGEVDDETVLLEEKSEENLEEKEDSDN